jgi:hypothetical protein
MKAFKDADAPLSLCPPELDPKVITFAYILLRYQRMCMRSKAWLAASVSLRLAPRLRLRQAFSRMLWSQNSKSWPYIAMLCRTRFAVR